MYRYVYQGENRSCVVHPPSTPIELSGREDRLDNASVLDLCRCSYGGDDNRLAAASYPVLVSLEGASSGRTAIATLPAARDTLIRSLLWFLITFERCW